MANFIGPRAHRQGSLPQLRSLAQGPPQTLTIDALGGVEDNAAPAINVTKAPRARTMSGIPADTRAGLKATGAYMGKYPEGTPAKLHSTMDFPNGRTLKTQGVTLIEEMGPVLDADEPFLQETFSRFDEAKIKNYVEQGAGGFYRMAKKRWDLPKNATREKAIYERMVELTNDILETFLPSTSKVTREVLDTHDLQFHHKEQNYTSPDLVVRAEGASFEKPKHAETGYSNVATYFDVKRESDMGVRDTHIKQLSLYAR